jgi:hypothetical protein
MTHKRMPRVHPGNTKHRYILFETAIHQRSYTKVSGTCAAWFPVVSVWDGIPVVLYSHFAASSHVVWHTKWHRGEVAHDWRHDDQRGQFVFFVRFVTFHGSTDCVPALVRRHCVMDGLFVHVGYHVEEAGGVREQERGSVGAEPVT